MTRSLFTILYSLFTFQYPLFTIHCPCVSFMLSSALVLESLKQSKKRGTTNEFRSTWYGRDQGFCRCRRSGRRNGESRECEADRQGIHRCRLCDHICARGCRRC